ncbi:MAG TPA: Clp protease N-terminal domain-containing protein [Planktothrix sp.]|jgi:ATP-dependent Clp protease ATP-binding subunit ClpC
MFENFSEGALKSLLLAQSEAKRYGIKRIGTEEILLGLIGEGAGLAAKTLVDHGVTLSLARATTEGILDYRGEYENNLAISVRSVLSNFCDSFVEYDFSPKARCVLERSAEQARQRSSERVETEHVLAAILSEDKCIATQVLESLGIEVHQLAEQLKMLK